MAETSLNERRSLSTADTANVDLHVENGTITDGAGNPVVIGEIHNETEQSFGKADAGVTEVKGATPTGNLKVNSNGEIVVDGYGTVTLVGPRREVSKVGGTDGEAGNLQTKSDGGVEIEYEGYADDTQVVGADTAAGEDPRYASETIDLSNASFKQSSSYRQISIATEVRTEFKDPYDYTLKATVTAVDGNQNTVFTETPSKSDSGGPGFEFVANNNYFTRSLDVIPENWSITIEPRDDDDGDGKDEYYTSANGTHVYDGANDTHEVEVAYQYLKTFQTAVSLR